MRVRAIRDGYYGDYRRVGDVFTLKNPAVEFADVWMQDAALPSDPRTEAASVDDELAAAGVKGAFATKLQGENDRLKEQVQMLAARLEALSQPGEVVPVEAAAPSDEPADEAADGETPPEDAAGETAPVTRRRRTPVS